MHFFYRIREGGVLAGGRGDGFRGPQASRGQAHTANADASPAVSASVSRTQRPDYLQRSAKGGSEATGAEYGGGTGGLGDARTASPRCGPEGPGKEGDLTV
jgi:hypothetical protein